MTVAAICESSPRAMSSVRRLWSFFRGSVVTLPLALRIFSRAMTILFTYHINKLRGKTVGQLMEERAKLHPQKTLFYFENDTWTYDRVNKLSNQVANYFATKGFRKGDVVGLVMENCPENICTWLGLSKIGVVSSIVNTNLKRESLKETLLVGKPKATIFHTYTAAAIQGVLELGPFGQDLYCFGKSTVKNATNLLTELKDVSDRNPKPQDQVGFNDELFYLYTSGSTGLPKAVPFRHSRFLVNGSSIHTLWGLNSSDTLYMFLPLYHTAGGAFGTAVVLYVGGSMVIRKKFSASNFWKDCVQHNVTVVQYIGEICRYLLRQPPSPEETQHRVRLFFGNGLREEIWRTFVDRFRIPMVGEVYGATECNAGLFNIDGTVGTIGYVPRWLQWMAPAALIKVNEDTGEPIRNPKTGLAIQCQINEPGEWVSITGGMYSLVDFHGYKNADTSKKILKDIFKKGDTCYRSEDIMVIDDYGYVRFKDRAALNYRWKGENISAIEVENTISRLIGLKDVAAYGVKIPAADGYPGMVTIADPDGTLDANQLLLKMKQELPSYAWPVFIRLAKSIETTGTYKTLKKTLQQEGYNIRKFNDKVLVLLKGKYVALNIKLYEDIRHGRVTP